MNGISRPEHPRPRFFRKSWENLNGVWEYAFDFSLSGREKGWNARTSLDGTITVPFCPESARSGVGFTDFLPAVWLLRRFDVPAERLAGDVLLHFGAVDYEAEVFVNGAFAGRHTGGYTPFALDVTALLRAGENILVVYARDDVRSGLQPSGKQSAALASEGCYYTRTTGVWQTVWREFVPKQRLSDWQASPDARNGKLDFAAFFHGDTDGCALRVRASLGGKPAGETLLRLGGAAVRGSLAVQPVRLWSVESPALYDLELTLERGGTVLDRVESYFGLRSVELREGCLFLNGTPVFQRLVLDQGFYPDGVYTAPDDEAIRRDILLSKSLGFNGARMHEKVFEERYLYWADRLGYLVWGEFPNWGLDITTPAGLEIFLPQWAEAMRRDFGSPALIGWCPFNETWDFGGVRQDDGVLAEVYRYTKTADPLRPCIDTSGNYHVATDIFDIHDYEQDPKAFAAHYAGGPHVTFGDRQRYGGEPYMVSEYGGARWDPSGGAGWGYGSDPRSEDEFAARYEALTRTLMQTPCCCGFCYTQLYDVEQERNGLFTYARKAKFSQKVYDRIRNVNTETAAIEKRLL